MKKRCKFILVILTTLIISVTLKSNLTGSSVAMQTVKVEVSVMEKLEKEKEVSVIVLLKDEDVENKDKVLSTLSLESLDEDFKLKHKYSIINGFSAEVTKKGLEKLKNNPKVDSIYLDKIYHIFLDTSVPLINADDVWNLQFGNTNITGKNQAVCILDTGVDYTHPNLGGCTQEQFLSGNCSKVIGGYCYCELQEGCCPNAQTSDRDIIDDNGHGTHIAGIVASDHETYKGVAPDANLIVIKVCNSTGACANSDVIAGIEWCTNNATKFNISVISMSFGSVDLYLNYCDENGDDENDNEDDEDGETSLTAVINAAIAQNITVVAATGNNGSTTQIAAPACIQNVTAVSVSDDNDAIASFSNRNNITDLLAPGVNIHSTKWSGFVDDSGTSMSAPHVAGAVALVAQFFREQNGRVLTPSEIETVLKITGKQINDSGGSNLNFSRIDIYSAVLSLDSVKPNIILESPENNSYINSENKINLTIIEPFLSQVWWSNNSGQINNTLQSPYSISTTNFLEGLIIIDVWANDSNANKAHTIYQFIFDDTKPIINLISPANNTNSTNFLQEFNFTVTDNLALNISCDLTINGSTIDTTAENSTLTTINYTFLKDGNYYWNITCWDNADNVNVTETRVLTIIAMAPNITINSPKDFFGTANKTIIFNVTVYDDLNLTNVSLFGNWNDWHLNKTNSSGVNNVDYIFTKNFTNYGEGIYKWYIEACDNSNNCAHSANKTFIIDLTKPSINLISPSNGTTLTTSTVTFQYNVTDIAIANCSLVINDEINETNTNVTANTIQSFSKDLENGEYNWSVNCVDYSGYENSSDVWKFIVNYQVASGASGASGGGGGGWGSSRTTTKTVLCIENWQCSDWSDCSILNRRVRACTDLNNCGTTLNKPIIIESCVYVALVEKVEEQEGVKNESTAEKEIKPVQITGGAVRNFLLSSKVGFGLLMGVIVLILAVLAVYFFKRKNQ